MVRLRAYRRFFVVAWQFLPLLWAYTRDRNRFVFFGSARQVDVETQRERANRLLESLLTLGPTFIKLGQLLSTRPDVLPPAYIDELSKLQDEVPPAEWEEARRVLETDLGPVEERFEEFNRNAISGASLGQVYRAYIDDRLVAVKVRRPGIESLIEADLRVIKFSLPLLLRFVQDAQAFSLENLADEFAKTIREEMDYEREADMLREIRANFEDNDRVLIPEIVDTHSTGRVLTMEYIGGTKISNVRELDERGIDRHELAETLQRTYLQMIVDDGVFHADPHPGNLAVREDGAIVFYDFGMSGRVDSFIQNKIVEFYIAVANQDIDAILDTLIEMGTLSPEADRQVMGDVMELAIADVRGEQIEQYRVNQIISQIENTIYEFPLRLPSNLALVLRVATVVEGVCVTLDPDFDFIETATEYLTEEGYREETARQFAEETGRELWESTQASIRLPQTADRTLAQLERGDVTINVDIEDPNDVFDRFAKRLIYGLLLSVTLISTSIIYSFRAWQPAVVPALLSVFIVYVLYRSFTKRRKGIRARPQFTRQSMRQRREE
ncbi:AarF/ABC1/UbiB kinase family protein [Halalkalicoccus sp. NIPERK01]|uniref:ABC1 kinase family protein n=1 Tax=Halalkalicoccus sp. NIPERK01 TaxID=3053469 RepID=UPI00256F42D4|nr:AarF/ABC1/UbiB kinase family protein [Halalkalicoccus sp. NIPERK01]MDL5362617.1 AarF/ABC1/UbiB kinase family protein [Halalkalicoccus sp. NIPERK01]